MESANKTLRNGRPSRKTAATQHQIAIEITKQIARFEGYSGCSQSRSTELFEAMVDVCHTLDDVVRLGQHLMELCRFYPTSAEIFAFARQDETGAGTYRDMRLAPACSLCKDMGFVDVFDADGTKTGVDFCQCHPARRSQPSRKVEPTPKQRSPKWAN